MMIVAELGRVLPTHYVAEPTVHLGSSIEIDVATFDDEGSRARSPGVSGNGGGAETAVWAPPEPTLAVLTEPPDLSEYAVRVYDVRSGRRLVAAVEIVSPANKDRPEHRRALVAKCAGLLTSGVCVVIIDVVTSRAGNLHGELLDFLGQADRAQIARNTSVYAASTRWIERSDHWLLENWCHSLSPGRPLPTLPLWLEDDLSVPLELEASYEETCRILRIP
jgi:hypothetical protein